MLAQGQATGALLQVLQLVCVVKLLESRCVCTAQLAKYSGPEVHPAWLCACVQNMSGWRRDRAHISSVARTPCPATVARTKVCVILLTLSNRPQARL